MSNEQYCEGVRVCVCVCIVVTEIITDKPALLRDNKLPTSAAAACSSISVASPRLRDDVTFRAVYGECRRFSYRVLFDFFLVLIAFVMQTSFSLRRCGRVLHAHRLLHKRTFIITILLFEPRGIQFDNNNNKNNYCFYLDVCASALIFMHRSVPIYSVGYGNSGHCECVTWTCL